jgi:multidrug efflux pump subunit AcrB
MHRMIVRPVWRYAFLGGVALMLLGAMSLVALKLVRVKMLPFDNKSEFQVVIDMPKVRRSKTPPPLLKILPPISERCPRL